MQPVIKNRFNHILHKLFEHPSIVLIGGTWKSGKTDFALYLAEKLLRLPSNEGAGTVITEVATNIDTKGKYPLVADLVNLRRWLYESTKRKLYILDEASEHLGSRRAMSAKNVGFIQLIPEISKAHGRLLVVGHQLMHVDKQLLDEVWCRGIFIKLGLKKAQLMSLMFPEEYVFGNIPPTSVPFDPYAIAPFQESPSSGMMFKDEDKQLIWEWCNGKTYKELGIHNMTLNRKIRGYLKAILENDLHVTHT
jgi:hypothetical protein